MNTSRATVGIAIFFLAAALSLAGTSPHNPERRAAFSADPSLTSATEAFRSDETKSASLGNVEDMTY